MLGPPKCRVNMLRRQSAMHRVRTSRVSTIHHSRRRFGRYRTSRREQHVVPAFKGPEMDISQEWTLRVGRLVSQGALEILGDMDVSQGWTFRVGRFVSVGALKTRPLQSKFPGFKANGKEKGARYTLKGGPRSRQACFLHLSTAEQATKCMLTSYSCKKRQPEAIHPQ